MSAVLPASAEEESTQGAGHNSLVGTADVLNSKGDVNGDGKVNTADKDLLNKWLVRLVGENELDMENADVNMDGKVDIMDLVELSKLCKPESGSSDEDTFEQHIDEDSEIFSEINTEDNAFKVSLDITASDDVTASLSASESEYSSVIESNMVVGVVPEFECEEGISVNDVALNFSVEESFTENTNGKYAAVSKDFEGIKRFNVFKYFDDIGMLLPVETTYDTENNMVTTHVDELGTYCLVDMEQWFENLGITPEEYKKTLTQKTNENNTTAIKTSAKAGDTIVETDFIPESNEQVFRYAEAKGLYKDGDNYELDHNKQKNKTLDIAIDMSVGIGNDEKIRELVKLEAKSFLYFVYNFHFDESCNIRVLFYNYDMNKSWNSGCWQPDNYKFYREAYNYEDCVRIIDNINVREGYTGKYPETIDEHNSFRPDIRYLEKTIPFSRDNTIWFEPDSFYVFNKNGYITYMDYEGILFRFRNNIAIYTLIESGKASPYFKFRDYRINKNIKTMAVSFLPYMSCFCSPISEDERYDDAMKSSSLYSFDDYMYFGYERSLRLSRYIAGLPELNNNNDNNNGSGSGNNSGSGSGNNSGSGSGNNKDYLTILPTGWKKISLEKPIKKDYKNMIDGITPISEFNPNNYADTDGDGLIDLREIRYSFNGEDVIKWDSNGNAILPTIKECRDLKAGETYVDNALSQYHFWEWDDINDIKILPIYSDPTEKDTDFDDFIDSKDPDPMNYNTITIDDSLLDDSDSVNGNNPTITKEDTDKMIDHVEAVQTNMNGGDCCKNEFKFTRTRKYGKTDGKFALTPSENSDFAFTITGTNEIMPEGEYTTDDFNSTVKIFYKKGVFKKEEKQVKPVEIKLSDERTEITYVFALEKDIEYSIYVNNPTNDHEGEYELHVSEDNWVYAKYGGVRNIEEKDIGYEESYTTVYLSDEAFYLMVKNYYEMTLTEDSHLQDETKETLLKKDLGACYQNLRNVKWVLYGYDEYMDRIGKEDSLADIFSGYNPTGDIITIAGIFLVKAPSPVGIAISVLGLANSIGNQFAEHMMEKYEDDIVKAMFDGNYNISFTSHHHFTKFAPDVQNETYTESVDKWNDYYYINKYKGIQRGDVKPFKLYEIQADGEAFNVIPKS